jgi:hypothetical protein
MASRIRSKLKKNVNLNAELVSADASLSGVVETMSPDDVYVRTSPDQASFLLEKELKLNIQLSSEETISLLCNATSSHIHNHPVHGLVNRVSLKVMGQSVRFKEFFTLG